VVIGDMPIIGVLLG